MHSAASLSLTTSAPPPLSRLVLDALPFTIYSVDLDGVITSANRRWSMFANSNGACDIAPESAAIGRSIFSSVADDASRDQIERAMSLLREGRVPAVSWEFPCSSPDEERIFLMQITALRLDDMVTGFVFATVDITPSHRSREALINAGIALSEAISLDRVYAEVAIQMRRAVPSHGLVIALEDAESHEFRIVHRNGYDEELRERSEASLQQRLASSWRDALDRRSVALDHSSSGFEITVPLVSNARGLGAVTLSAREFDSSQTLEEAERVLTVLASQTAVAIERAWLVQRVEQKQRLESVGEVAAGVAHELRNPLFGISSAAQLLRFRSREDPVIEKNVARILREVDRLNRMVTSLLDFGRPDAIKLACNNPETVWDDILDGDRARMDARHIAIVRTRTDDAVLCAIDVEQLGQVFRNVLGNAIDATADGATITLTSQLTSNGGWRCRVHNSGPTIPPDVLPHVFEFFYSTKPGGTGIGLALCLRIVHEHRGTITLDSASEQGTTLTITLPLAHQP